MALIGFSLASSYSHKDTEGHKEEVSLGDVDFGG
jgi:hypothetical protein